MNRNVNSHFAVNPTRLDISRSRFDRSSSVKLSFNVGDLIPFYIDEVLPADTFSIDTSKVVRLQTMLTPVMDNIYLDTYWFFVPNRLVWEHWKEFCGENSASAWIPSSEYSIPQISAPQGGFDVGTIADYFGIPTGISNISVSALPFRAYALICNEFFRDENLSDPLNIPVTDSNVVGVNTGNYVTDTAKGGLPFKAAKYFDYFTGALPSAQKGPAVTIPVGSTGLTPVLATNVNHDFSSLYKDENGDFIPLYFTNSDSYTYANVNYLYGGLYTSDQTAAQSSSPKFLNPESSDNDTFIGKALAPTNLWAMTQDGTPMATINQLRMAFQIQKMYERDARGGTRYISLLKSHFGVTSPDARLQRPEYLGGNRIPININQVLQQSGTLSTGTPQGTPTGASLTTDTHSDFTKSFTEHGYIIGLCVARYDHTYQQGIERMWSRKTRFDYYWPVFANIGEQAILNKEIFAQGSTVVNAAGDPVDEEVFGYQEAWADYRYKPNRVAGEMRSAYAQSLDVWHLADDYATLPQLSDAWIREDKSNVDRVLAVSSAVSNQLFADIYIRNVCTRAMPMYSVPGLIDHH